jgi:hypothetical protein
MSAGYYCGSKPKRNNEARICNGEPDANLLCGGHQEPPCLRGDWHGHPWDPGRRPSRPPRLACRCPQVAPPSRLLPSP